MEREMALPQQFVEKDTYTEDEYFAFEQSAFGRWEYCSGEIRAMSGGTDDHNAIASNVVGALRNPLVPRGCRVYGSDMKIHTGNGINTFPDVAVVCGPRVYYRNRKDVITNPILVVEVLSDSTKDYDRGEKFDHYKTIPSLSDYLLISPGDARVQLYSRKTDHWELRDVSGLESTIYLPSVDTTITMSDIYLLIEFAQTTI
jgi:Uma2 family endonuclease